MMRLRAGMSLVALTLCGTTGALLQAEGQAGTVRVYGVEDAITAPELLPADLPLPAMATCKVKNQQTLHAGLAMVVDDQGQPRNLSFLSPSGTDLDNLALRLAATNRFKPATREGKPVAMWEELRDDFTVCVEKNKNSDGEKVQTYRLAAAPVQQSRPLQEAKTEVRYAGAQPSTDSSTLNPQRVGKSIAAPVALLTPIAEYSIEARKKKIQGECMVTVVVDAQGMPQNPRVTRSVEPSLDKKALEAVARYRFKPAMKDGLEPVAVLITVAVNFRLY